MRTQHLLDAATKVIVESGLEALTMEAVAERASVSRALGYFYFENRTELLRALYNREFGRLYDAMVPAFEAGGSLEERVRAGVKAYFDIVASRYDLFALLNTTVDGPQFRRDRRHRLRSWEQYVGFLVGDEFDLSPTKAGMLARIFVDVVARCTLLWKRDRLDRTEVEQLCIRFVLGGLQSVLGPEPGGAEPSVP
ncbi:TetR/AcrR family transcriptional regulator [Phenylobacterium sp.]|uniref:TetR/AcrR family transcriptional regulator n=1 Tax=Phenylobacterium sp. TaxID=1871053 RepID=UPI0025FDCEB7|nr:TetR/AcrR family transcriptional regulator [Phenylobacterium sp.]MBX3485453.1 TetR/AcrR family transcriptional regulator [Phenylobacterium sp.]MCW5758823.1 TetR/AcrR family transcriptional regulator [Phenylobacterium sp.]